MRKRFSNTVEKPLSPQRRSEGHRSAINRLIAFLNNLVLFKVDEEDLVIVPPPRTVQLSSFLRFGRPRR
jgi:hypothetical protein